ncbi:MAG: energy transducer TonB [Flavobacteriales bacterium]
MPRTLLFFLMTLPIALQAQFPMLIGASPAECKAYYIKQGMEVYFDHEFPDEPASLVAESRDYTIATMFDHEQAIHASVLSKSALSFSSIYEQYEGWIQEGKHKHPSSDDHSLVLSAFETTSEFPKLFIGLYDEVHQAETDHALKVLHCDWGLVEAFFLKNMKVEICGTALLENPSAPFELWKTDINQPDVMPCFPECENESIEKRDECTNFKIIEHITRNFKPLLNSSKTEVVGSIYASFVVDTTGQIKDITPIRTDNIEVKNEIIRVLSLLPKFIPGLKNGQPVETQYHIPIHINWR